MKHPCLLALLTAFFFAASLRAQPAPPTPDTYPDSHPSKRLAPYFPPRGEWLALPPAELDFDPEKLAAPVEWAKAQETDMPRDFSTQEKIFGRPLGPVPASRAPTNGIILRYGFIAAEWGDTAAADPSYSVAKSYLSTLLGLAVDRGLIAGVSDRVGDQIHDGGYDSPHNAPITWEHHATQTSEWEGELFGKPHTFLGVEEFGSGARRPRELSAPGSHYEYNDVRINRFSLSLLRVFNRPLPGVLKSEIMDPIGASNTWAWHAYHNAAIEVSGVPLASVSGGTRWGGGLWMSTRDHARFGLLVLRGGFWEGKPLISSTWLATATSPHGLNPGYGYLWWLNQGGGRPDASGQRGLRWPGASPLSFAAIGAGNNTVWIDPDHELVVVWRWHRGDNALPEFLRRLSDAIRG